MMRWICFALFIVFWVFKVYYSFKMANNGLGMDSNHFSTFLELPKMSRNPDPRTPYLSQKYLKKYKKKQIRVLRILVYISQNYGFPNLLEVWEMAGAEQ